MSTEVANTVELSMNKIALWIDVGEDDWTTEKVIIANNVYSKFKGEIAAVVSIGNFFTKK